MPRLIACVASVWRSWCGVTWPMPAVAATGATARSTRWPAMRRPRSMNRCAQDDVLDVLDRLLTDLLARVEKQERQRRLRTIGDLDSAALLLRDISLVVLDRATSDQTVRHEIFARVSLERIEQAIATVGALARPAENAQAPETLLSRYSMVRQFLPLLLVTLAPRATTGGQAVLAREFLHRLERTASAPMHEAPLRI